MIFVFLISIFLIGCSSIKHGYIIKNNVVGMNKHDFFKKYGESVVKHPMNSNIIFYFESYEKSLLFRKSKWMKIEIKNDVISSVRNGQIEKKLKSVPHVKPNLIKTKWVSELFDYVGSASI